VAVFIGTGIKYAEVVKGVYAHHGGGVDDLFIFQYHAYMRDLAIIIMKKGQVTQRSLLGKVDRFAYVSLLVGVSGQGYAEAFIEYLHEAGAVYAHRPPTAPEIGCIEIAHGYFLQHMDSPDLVGHDGLAIVDKFFFADAKVDPVKVRQ
jgi:hypothetical protein